MTINKKFNIQKEILTSILIVFVILFSGHIRAFGINSNYWAENPLRISPGDTTDIFLTLKSEITNAGNITVKASIANDVKIAKLIDSSDIYSVEPGGNRNVNIRVSMPRNAKVGDNYSIGITFTTVKENAEGGLGFGNSIKQNIPVTVVEKPKTQELATLTKNLWIVAVIIVVVIAAIIVAFVLLKKKKKL